MKTGVKKFLLVILMLILYLIAVTFLPSYSKLVKSSIDDNNSNRFENTNDIEDWNLPLNNLDYVYLNVKPKNSTTQGIILTNEEGIRLLNAFNAIQKNDIYWDQSPYTEALYGPLGIGIKVFYKNGEFISFIPNQAFMIYHNDAFYYTRYNLELFDEIRTLALTYDFEWLNLESELKTTNGLPVVGNYKDIVISPNTKVISTFSNIKKLQTILFDIKSIFTCGFKTYDDILEPYLSELEVNDTIEVNGSIIKILEMKNDKVIAISISIK